MDSMTGRSCFQKGDHLMWKQPSSSQSTQSRSAGGRRPSRSGVTACCSSETRGPSAASVIGSDSISKSSETVVETPT